MRTFFLFAHEIYQEPNATLKKQLTLVIEHATRVYLLYNKRIGVKSI